MASRTWIPFFVLAVGLTLTAAAAVYVFENAEAKDQTRFNAAVDRIQNAIKDRLDTYIDMLLGSKGLFAASNEVTRDEFYRYVERLELQRRYPGIQGIGFSRRVFPDEMQSVTARARGEGIADFRIWPEDPRSEYHTILYLEPMDRRNRRAIGYDMFTESVRREAMERARDTGLPAMSGRVILVQEIDAEKQAGFLIYVPVYSGGRLPESAEERRSRLSGFVYSPFRVDDLLRQIVASELHVDVQVYDGVGRRSEFLLHTSTGSGRDLIGSSAQLKKTVPLTVAGRNWTIAFANRPAFYEESRRGQTIAVAGVGVVISFLLFGIARAQANARAVAELSAAELRASEEALRQSVDREHAARTEAETANRLKDEFLATLSHELRTPLTPLLGWTHMLRTRNFDKAGVERGLQVIERNLRTQQQLIEDLLDVSRIIRGKLHLNTRPMDLTTVIQSAVDALQPAAQAKGVRLEADCDSDTRLVMGDPDRLQQVVWNLLSNAVKFTLEGGVVNVLLQYAASNAHITVKDTGEGISSDFLPHVFERFRQADSTTTRTHGGLGLGLAIVRYLVELHGGTVIAESGGRNLGSSFTVSLPLTEAVESKKLLPRKDLQRDALQGMRVMVVEDEPDTREFIGFTLQEAGAFVLASSSGDEALRRFLAFKPQVIVSDVAMPEMDGYEFLRKLRAIERLESLTPVPVVALTAHARGEERERLLTSGFQLHIPKPVRPGDLIGQIATLNQMRQY